MTDEKTPTAKDRDARERLDRDVEKATAKAGAELVAADAKRDRKAERAARAKLDHDVATAQRKQGASDPIVSRHTFTTDTGDELEGRDAVKAQQAAVVAAMDAENDARAEALGLPAPAHYSDGVP